MRWTGVFISDVTVNGQLGLTFQVGGARLWVNGQLLLDVWSKAGDHAVPFSFVAGTPVSFKLEYWKDDDSWIALVWNQIGTQGECECVWLADVFLVRHC